MVTDPIADMLNRIKNAGNANQAETLIPYSLLKMRIANVLLAEGYITSAVKKGKKVEKFIEVGIAYDAPRQPRVRGVARVSRPSRRIYASVSEIRPVRQGTGVMVLSTPKGLLTDKEARKEHAGGEVLFKIW